MAALYWKNAVSILSFHFNLQNCAKSIHRRGKAHDATTVHCIEHQSIYHPSSTCFSVLHFYEDKCFSPQATNLLQTMLIMSWRLFCSSFCSVKHAERLHVESTYTPHEGFLHGFFISLSL